MGEGAQPGCETKIYETNHLGWDSRPRLSEIYLPASRTSDGCGVDACHPGRPRPSVDSANTRRVGVSRRNCLACCWRQEKFLVRNYISAPPESRATHSPLMTQTC